MPRADTGRMENPWMVHQAQVAVDFARHNRVLTWLVGGLNHHKEHHLFPAICHVNYPSIAPIVEQTCRAVRHSLQGAPVLPGRPRRTLPLAAPHGSRRLIYA